MNDQEKLALAMGITDHRCINCEAQFAFDPFTDANDDYAVLEWFLDWTKTGFQIKVFTEELYQLNESTVTGYKIGNYAKAALKVLP